MNEESDIISLAARAKRAGIESVEDATAYLQGMIERSNEYLASRKKRKIHTAYDERVERDKTVLALAIVLLESLQGQQNEPL